MSERKVINKYYPPDFDPSKITKKIKTNKAAIDQKQTVRLMTPFSMKCKNCNEYISKSKKFNAKKSLSPEKYLDFKIYNFLLKCPRCNNDISFRTNPKNSNYTMNYGAIKNYDSKDELDVKHETSDEILERLVKENKEDMDYQDKKLQRSKDPFYVKKEKLNSIENLEAKILNDKLEQDIIDELENIKDRNQYLEMKRNNINLIEFSDKKDEDDDDDDEEISNLFKNYRQTGIVLTEPSKKRKINSVEVGDDSINDNDNENEKSNEKNNEMINDQDNEKNDDKKSAFTIKKKKNLIIKKSVSLVDYSSD